MNRRSFLGLLAFIVGAFSLPKWARRKPAALSAFPVRLDANEDSYTVRTLATGDVLGESPRPNKNAIPGTTGIACLSQGQVILLHADERLVACD